MRLKIDCDSLDLEGNLPFWLCFTLYLRAIFQVQVPGGLIFGGAYTWRGLFSEFYGNLHMNACAQGFALIKRFGVTQKSATSHVKIQTCPVIQGNTVYFNK